MPTVGGEEAGFSVMFDAVTSRVCVRAWGFWTAAIASEFVAAVLSECKSAAKHNPRQLELETSELKPQRDEGQEALGAMFSSIRSAGIERVWIRSPSQLTKLQLLRIIKERAARELVQFT